jgi:L-lactate utilization protein LutC
VYHLALLTEARIHLVATKKVVKVMEAAAAAMAAEAEKAVKVMGGGS